jgi:cardiolipin synthase
VGAPSPGPAGLTVAGHTRRRLGRLGVLGLTAAAVTLGGPAVAAHAAPTGATPAQLSLITEPTDGFASLYALLASPTTSLDMTMYQLDDPQVIDILDADAARGVDVRVLLDQSSVGSESIKAYNTPAYDQLTANGVHVEWASSAYTHTHEKSFVVDGTTAAIMTLNFTDEYYSTSRDFAVIDSDPADVAAIESVFASDWALPASRNYTDPPGDDLTWSPSNASSPPPAATSSTTTGQSVTDMVGVINGATTTLSVENEEMADQRIINALIEAAQRGVRVHVAMTYDTDYLTDWNELTAGGVEVATYDPNASLYIHAKVIDANQGLAGQRVFLGSENFSATSLNDNRELGIVTTDPAIVASVGNQVEADFAGGTLYPAVPPPTPSPALPETSDVILLPLGAAAALAAVLGVSRRRRRTR